MDHIQQVAEDILSHKILWPNVFEMDSDTFGRLSQHLIQELHPYISPDDALVTANNIWTTLRGGV